MLFFSEYRHVKSMLTFRAISIGVVSSVYEKNRFATVCHICGEMIFSNVMASNYCYGD